MCALAQRLQSEFSVICRYQVCARTCKEGCTKKLSSENTEIILQGPQKLGDEITFKWKISWEIFFPACRMSVSLLRSATCIRYLITEVSFKPVLRLIVLPVTIRHRTLLIEYMNIALTSMMAPFNPTVDEI